MGVATASHINQGVDFMADKTNEHGKPEKKDTIIVNAQPKEWSEKTITYDQVVELAFPEPQYRSSDWAFTVSYRKGVDKKDGTMSKGDSVHVKDGMIFDVSATNKS